ncbi:DUF1906 domain-containing protein [Yinghuangia sp. ASG 101]|uniref:glycoside hydrolase domain-containing protein n=1 Tax=Yinghuangia sp. ASG 101 TaxID=2896848 RepID=UPI001E5A1862|nr:glycoside hydrolase domain-containing protein [Yinghuangia sp. ASG 101]UGQ08929.1 DUF1906 domain-containing protein [Yinghuangia sp. ASG 101]
MRHVHWAGSAALLSLSLTLFLVPTEGEPRLDGHRVEARPAVVHAEAVAARAATGKAGRLPADVLSARSAALPPAAANSAGTPPAEARAVEAAPTRSILRIVDGAAFDTCEAPEVATMQAWRASPYEALGIYVGGSNRGCANKGLTRDWVSQVHAQGWEFMPIYVGAQAACTVANKSNRIDSARVADMAVTEADDAVARATDLGFKRGSALYFDMEEYDNTDRDCAGDVLDFVSAWSERVRSHGFTPGYYSSLSSGITDLVNAAGTRPLPDIVWYARWDDIAVTHGDGALPDNLWPGRRIKQHAGNVSETYEGITIKIDRNAINAPVGVL